MVDVSVKTGGKWSVKAKITIEDQAGNPVSGAYVAVRFTIIQNGSTFGDNCTTVDGECEVEWVDRLSLHSPIEAEVNAVVADPGWDGVLQTVLLYKP